MTLAAVGKLIPFLYHRTVVVLDGLLWKNRDTFLALFGELEVISITAEGPNCIAGGTKLRVIVKGKM